MCILAEMITSSETFNGLTITTYNNDKIYIECDKPITTEVLRERIAQVCGTDTDQRSRPASGHISGSVHDTPEIAGNTGDRLQD